MSVKVKDKSTLNEVYCAWYRCPACRTDEALAYGYRFCPYCGKELNWQDVPHDR